MVVGISMVRDEVDVIAYTLRAMLEQVDWVLIADNGSTDGTRDVLEQIAGETGRVTVRDDTEVGYFQARKMSALAAYAAAMLEARWVVPFDADERWYSPFGRIADVLAAQADDVSVVTAELYDHVATALDPDEPSPLERIGWRRRDPAPLPKVAARLYPSLRIHQGNHGADYGGRVDGQLVVRHYPYRSPGQFVSKARNGARAYAATDLPADQGQHWRDYGALLDAQGPAALEDVFRRWFWSANPRRDRLIFDPCPT